MVHTINGIEAQTDLAPLGTTSVQGSGKKPYILERHGNNTYSCSCPAWTFQKGVDSSRRTCKHLIALLGQDFETARILEAGGEIKIKAASKPKKAAKVVPSANAVASGSGGGGGGGESSTSGGLPVAPKVVDRLPGETAAQTKKRKKDEDEEQERKKKPKVVKKTAKALPKQRPPKNAPPSNASASEEPETVAAGGGNEEEEDDDSKPQLMLAHKWDVDGSGVDPKGFWMSEKLDGVRGYWNGKIIVSRAGNIFSVPQWFLDKLPEDLTLDGELYLSRGAFSETNGIIKSKTSNRWSEMVFKVFDAPSSPLAFEERLSLLHTRFGSSSTGNLLDGGENKHAIAGNLAGTANAAANNQRKEGVVEVVEHVLCDGREHVMETLKIVQELDGEGLMLRKPKTKYKGTRTTDLLKVKTFFDAEAKVEGYEDGKGKHSDKTGSLKCVMESGKKFKVGSGLTDAQRVAPPAIGSIVRYRFFELSKDGIPRFPTFVGEAIDKDAPKDAEVPDKRRAGTAAAAAKGDE
ncbi:hypothetical protein BDY24DRAFT_377587 [Mrakia frigida]|uniref:uncharacterized protein n=1 Tax=Mrakia frigida TaxID=29902 RepID=UPI003FCBFC30